MDACAGGPRGKDRAATPPCVKRAQIVELAILHVHRDRVDRLTKLRLEELFPVLLPSYVMDQEPDRGVGFLRSPGSVDDAGRRTDPDRRRAFFTEEVGLSL